MYFCIKFKLKLFIFKEFEFNLTEAQTLQHITQSFIVLDT